MLGWANLLSLALNLEPSAGFIFLQDWFFEMLLLCADPFSVEPNSERWRSCLDRAKNLFVIEKYSSLEKSSASALVKKLCLGKAS